MFKQLLLIIKQTNRHGNKLIRASLKYEIHGYKSKFMNIAKLQLKFWPQKAPPNPRIYNILACAYISS